MKKSRWLLLGCAFIAILVVSGAIPLSPLGSGSGWEFDYTLESAYVNGSGFGVEDVTSPPADTTTGDGGGGGGSYLVIMAALLSHDAYNMAVDPDGLPTSHFPLGVHTGLAPNIAFHMGHAVRVASDGTPINAYDNSEDARQVGSEMWYLYYYAFDFYIETQSRPYTAINQYWQPYTTAEAGIVEGYAYISVRLQETLWSDIDGEFMTATVMNVRHNVELLHESGAVFGVQPDISAPPDNTGLEIQDRTPLDHSYECRIQIPFALQAGLTRIDLGQNYVPADVWVSMTIVTELLLREPLNIGDTGDNLDGGKPPKYTPPFDLRLVAIIAFAFLVLVVILFFWSKSKAKQPSINVYSGGYRGYNN